MLLNDDPLSLYLAEATFNHLAPPGWTAISAGSKPTGQVHPRSLEPLRREGSSAEGYYSKSWDTILTLPLAQLIADPTRLKAELDRIGELS